MPRSYSTTLMLTYDRHMALTTVSVHIEIREPVTDVPAVGTVVFNTLIELRDVVDNVVYAPMTFTAALAAGEATIVLPATDNPDLTPVNWVYQAWINTDILNTVQYFQIPFSVGVVEFADLAPLDFDPCTDQIPLSTPIAPSDYNLFVRRAGDTMTGNLTLAGGANLTVSGLISTEFTGTTLNVGQLLAMSQSTSVLSGGEFTPGGAPPQVNISAMTGFIVDYNSSAPLSVTNPSIKFISWPGVTNHVPAFVTLTHFLIDSTGTLVELATIPTPQQRRQMIYLGVTAVQGGVLLADQTLPTTPSQVNNQLVDLMYGLNAFNTSGNVCSPNGINLSINKTAGTIFARAFGQVPNYEDPHNSALAAQTPVNFRHITRAAGSAGALTTLLDVGNFDNAGVVTPVGGGANTSTNFRIWGFAANTVNEQVFIQYGQSTFASLTAAVQAIPAGAYIPNPATVSAALLGWISVTRTATDLSDPAQAVFTAASKFANP